MPAVPAFILRTIYVVGSLVNTAEGCQFQLKNTLAPATITHVGPISIDGTPWETRNIVFMRGGARIVSSEIGPGHTVSFDINDVVTIIVNGVTLARGEHRIGLDVTTREAGRLRWEICDQVMT